MQFVFPTLNQAGVITCLTLSANNVVTEFKEVILELIPHIDFLFGNENEYTAMGQILGLVYKSLEEIG